MEVSLGNIKLWRSLFEFFFIGKSSQNSPIPVLIFGSSIPYMYSVSMYIIERC